MLITIFFFYHKNEFFFCVNTNCIKVKLMFFFFVKCKQFLNLFFKVLAEMINKEVY
jgi:hypothetical protein